MIDTVLFDMDGVLVDARSWHYNAFNKAIGLFGYNVTLQEHENYLDGLPTLKKLEFEGGFASSPLFVNATLRTRSDDSLITTIHLVT